MLILTHDTTGGGVPDALQDWLKSPPSVIVSFCKGWMVDDTGVKNQNESKKKGRPTAVSTAQIAQILKLYVLQTTA